VMNSFPKTAQGKAMVRHIGERLRWVREAYGLSQAEMARLFGIDQTTWGKWETGARALSIQKMPEVVARLKISVDYLIGNTLEGVERDLAIRLAAAHPELAASRRTGPDKGTPQA